MKKRFLIISLSVTLGGLVLLTFFSTFIYHNNLVDSTIEHLRVYMLSYERNAEKFAAFDNEAATSLSAETGGARVTFIDTDGNVLGDSDYADIGENHIMREEVKSALGGGDGYAVRGSDTAGREFIYYCKKYTQPDILVRIAVSGNSVWTQIIDLLPLLLIFMLADVGLCFLLSGVAVRGVMRPVEEFSRSVRDSNALPLNAPYRELDSLASILTQLKRDNKRQLSELRRERERENVILDNMEHGIIIMRGTAEVLLINKAAERTVGEVSGGVPHLLAEDSELLDAVESGSAVLLYREWGGKDYAVRVSHVESMKAAVLLITDVTEVRRAERTKDEFIANVTHEMNTPLTAISGFAQLIEAGGLKPEQIKRNAHVITEQSERLSRLIKSILGYSAIEAQTVEDSAFDLLALVSGILRGYSAAAKVRGITLDACGRKTVITAPQDRVREAAENLISNAVRYNRDGGSVTVTVGESDGRASLTVSDTGIGIAEKDRERVFDRFFTADTSHSSGGFGLGLAIVKKLAKTHGWQVSLSSTPAVGTEITIVF